MNNYRAQPLAVRVKGNVKFTLCPRPAGLLVICAYGQHESTWGPYPTFCAAAERILEACRNLDKVQKIG